MKNLIIITGGAGFVVPTLSSFSFIKQKNKYYVSTTTLQVLKNIILKIEE